MNDPLRIILAATTKTFLRRIKSVNDSSTELLHELGTTDVAIGDATAEIMITTLGKIPNEMYDLEETTVHGKAVTVHDAASRAMLDAADNRTAYASFDRSADGYAERSTLLLVLLTALLIILLLCCITACAIARSRSRGHALFRKSDVECGPECGANRPLLDRASDTTATTKTTSSAQN